MSISKGKKKTNLDLNLTPYTKLTQNVKLLHRRKTSGPTTWRTVLRHDTKCMVHKRKISINWTSSKLKLLLCKRLS